MVVSCAAFGCKEKFLKGGPYTFHCFPRDKSRKKEWEKQLRRKNFTATPHTRLCSKHFEDSCFKEGKFGGTWLKPDATPTIFDFPLHLLPIVKKEGKTNLENAAPLSEPFGQKRCAYIGDFSEEDMNSLSMAKEFYNLAKDDIQSKRKKIDELQHKNKWLEKKVYILREILKGDKEKFKISEPANEALKEKEKCGDTRIKPDATSTIFDFLTYLLSKEKKGRKRNLEKASTSDEPSYFIGNFCEEDMGSSSIAKQFYNLVKDDVQRKRKKMVELQQKTRRLENKIRSLRNILEDDEEKLKISESANEALKSLEKRSEIVERYEINLSKLNLTTFMTSAPGPSTQMEPDSSMVDQDVHLAMTCDIYPADEPPRETLINIKKEPMDPDKRDILSASVMQELRHFSNEPSSTSNLGSSLLQPPVLIKEEPITSEDES